MRKASLPDQTRLTQVHLRTRSLERALAFYSGVLGIEASASEGSEIVLGTSNSPELLKFTEDPQAPSRPRGSTGLFHLALRYGSRGELAGAYHRLLAAGYPLAGASDHGVSEALYLSDPEGNGVELYVDRPRAAWPFQDGQIAMVTAPLDLDALAQVSDEQSNRAPEPDLGHIHLQVAVLAAAERFYNEFLGLAVTQRSYPGALFFAAGGYHHHIGVNTWAAKTQPPAGAVGLISYRLEVPCSEILYCLGHRAPLLGYRTEVSGQPELLKLRDPNGHWLEVRPAPGSNQVEVESALADRCGG